MRLWHSFLKDMKLSSKNFYFYVEIFIAVLLLVVLLFVIPENFEKKSTEYVYFDLPEAVESIFLEAFDDTDGIIETVELEVEDKIINADLHIKHDIDEVKKYYVINNEEDMIYLADKERDPGASIFIGEDNKVHYKYYIQGYESQKLKNLLLILHNKDMDLIEDTLDNQDVRALDKSFDTLSDRENTVPMFLTYNGALMGLFIIAAFIFLDKKEGVIKAYAVTPGTVWEYLLSKVFVLIVNTMISSLIIILPVMKLQPNYFAFTLLVISSSFFASSLGLIIASFYDDMMNSFGGLLLAIIPMMLPVISYTIPSWNPTWIKFIPSYYILAGFKETILSNGDFMYSIVVSGGIFILGLIIFIIANNRFKKTLTV